MNGLHDILALSCVHCRDLFITQVEEKEVALGHELVECRDFDLARLTDA